MRRRVNHCQANDESPKSFGASARCQIRDITTLYVNDLDHGAYISATLRLDETPDPLSARVAIYRMMVPVSLPQKTP